MSNDDQKISARLGRAISELDEALETAFARVASARRFHENNGTEGSRTIAAGARELERLLAPVSEARQRLRDVLATEAVTDAEREALRPRETARR